MALPIRDGNQSLTTLSTILVGNAHIPAHSVVSLGSQAITDIATAVSGVELGPNTISALENISVTFGSGTSITIGNVVSVTGGLTNTELRASAVTIGGSVSVSNFPVTQAVTFGHASVTFTQAPVTFGQAVVSASNIGFLNASVATDGISDATLNFIKIGGHQSGSNQTAHIVHVSAGGSMSVDASGSSVTFTQASVTFNSITGYVSIQNYPATQAVTFGTAVITGSTSIIGTPSITFTTATITGSVSILNFPATQSVTFTQIATHGVTIGAGTAQIGSVTASISGTPSVTFTQASVTFGNPTITGSVSILNFPATQQVSGSVTANVDLSLISNAFKINNEASPDTGVQISWWDDDADESRLVRPSQPLPIQGMVTASLADVTDPIQDNGTSGKSVAVKIYDLNGVPIGPQSSIPVSGSVTLGTGTSQIGSVTASVSNSITIGNVVTISNVQGTSVTTSNFTSTTMVIN